MGYTVYLLNGLLMRKMMIWRRHSVSINWYRKNGWVSETTKWMYMFLLYIYYILYYVYVFVIYIYNWNTFRIALTNGYCLWTENNNERSTHLSMGFLFMAMLSYHRVHVEFFGMNKRYFRSPTASHNGSFFVGSVLTELDNQENIIY